MNKSVLIILFLFPTIASAQEFATDRGGLLVGGSAGFVTDGESSLLYLLPRAQYFVIPGLALGGTLGMSTGFNDVTFSGGPAVSYFFGDGESKLAPFVSGRAMFNESLSTYTASGGAILFLNPYVGVTGEVYYSHEESDFSDGDTAGLSFGIAAFVF